MEILKALNTDLKLRQKLQKRKTQKDIKPNYGYEHAKSKKLFVGLPQNFMQYIFLYNEMHAQTTFSIYT